MNRVFVDAYNIISPLGKTAEENYRMLIDNKSGLRKHTHSVIDSGPVFASLIAKEELDSFCSVNDRQLFTDYEYILVNSVKNALLDSTADASGKDTLFVFSTTKGNISLLENTNLSHPSEEPLNLMESALKVCAFFNNPNKPVVISHACISGVSAIIYAQRMLASGIYRNVIVAGADFINRFIYSGFQSFNALSAGKSMPFSETRDGINLGDAAATLVLTTDHENRPDELIEVLHGAITNDANHISGPSRTGDELASAISKALELSNIKPEDINFISAHGTATPFNDEMEARAINTCGLQHVPVNSLKGYFGHTLGAAGLVESIISIMALKNDMLIASAGFVSPGVKPQINVQSNNEQTSKMRYCLKTASGFGGCNAAIIFSKN